MNISKSLKVVNPLLFLAVLTQALTGAVFILKIKTVHRHFIAELHEYNGIFLVVIALTHLALNWGWVKTNFLKRAAASS